MLVVVLSVFAGVVSLLVLVVLSVCLFLRNVYGVLRGLIHLVVLAPAVVLCVVVLAPAFVPLSLSLHVLSDVVRVVCVVRFVSERLRVPIATCPWHHASLR